MGFILCCSKQKNTYTQWAAEISILQKCSVSKQGLFERITESAVNFAKQLLQHVITKQLTVNKSELFKCFNKVILQDSTTLKLPDCLATYFPGNVTRGMQKAVARIQCVINIKNFSFLAFTLNSFTCNDQSASKDIIPLIKKGDLLIRDLGYFSLKCFEQIICKKAHILSRLRYGISLYDTKGNAIRWKQLCKKGRIVDKIVLMGEQRLPMRLVMIPLPSKQVAERIRKARNDRDKRLNHSKDYYQWLHYTVFITDVQEEVWTAQQITAAYKIRWQIEIIFKSWKSGLHLQKILHDECTNENRVQVNIYFLLIFICLFMQKIYVHYKDKIEKRYSKTISLLKLCAYMFCNIIAVFTFSSKKLIEEILRHCCYDKRSDRVNMTDLIKIFKN